MPHARLRVALIAAGLLLVTNGPLLFFAGRVLDRPGFPPPWEDVAVRPVLLAFAALVTVVVVREVRAGGPVAELRANRAVLVAVAVFPLWAVASALWSEQPGMTLWRSLVYVGLAWFAVAVAVLDDRDLTLALLFVTGPAVAVSAVLAVTRPSVGRYLNGFWQGVYTNPNSLGPIAAIAILVGVGAWWHWREPLARAAIGALIVVSAVVLHQTTSRTSWFALAVAAVAAAAVVGTRRLVDGAGSRRATAVAVPIGAAGVLALVVALWSRWDDPTFAQRRTIWEGAWSYVDERWVQGYGFFSFFEVPGRALEQPFFDRGSAHSSPLEVLLGLGLIGLVPFVIVVVAALANAGRRAWRDPSALPVAWLAVVVFLVVENLTESFVLWFSYNWVLLCAAALRLPEPEPALPTAPSPPRAVEVA